MKMLKLYILIVFGPWLISRLFKHRMEWRNSNPPEYTPETELERTLNDAEAQKRFLHAWQVTKEENRLSETSLKWHTPEEVLLEERIERTNDSWEPSIPGVVFEKH